MPRGMLPLSDEEVGAIRSRGLGGVLVPFGSAGHEGDDGCDSEHDYDTDHDDDMDSGTDHDDDMDSDADHGNG